MLAAKPGVISLAERARKLAAGAEKRWGLTREDDPPDVRERARQLRDHVTTYIVPRANALDLPLLVVLLGPTGAGKSSLMNTLAGGHVSETGVLRPTTRRAVLLATDADAEALRGVLSTIGTDRVIRAHGEGARPGVAIVDAPDLDSVELANRAVADKLVEAADLCVFVTTAVRYADRAAYLVLERIAARGLPVLIVANRLPPDEEDVVLEDIRRVLRGTALRSLDEERIEVIGVREGALGDNGSLQVRAVMPILERINQLAADRERRRAVVERALQGAVEGLSPLVDSVAADLEHSASDAAALRTAVDKPYEAERDGLNADLSSGAFMRTEVLRHWESFVRADQITRFFSRGLVRVRGTVLAVIKGTPPTPVGVEREVTSDIVAVTVAHAHQAARRTAEEWSTHRGAASWLAREPSLWSASPDLDQRLELRLRDWVASIAHDVQARGAPKRELAFGVSLGVNALAIAAMIGVFAHTAGVTGTEVGIVAATGFLNQKLLQAIFGEAAMTEMVTNARRRLETLLDEEFARERARYERLVPDAMKLRALATDLREASAAA